MAMAVPINEPHLGAVMEWHKNVSSMSFVDKLKQLYQSKDDPFCDVKIKTVDKRDGSVKILTAHSFVLEICSRKFAEVICTCPKVDKSSSHRAKYVIEVDNVSPQVMEYALEFMYTDNIQDLLPWKVVGGLVHAAEHLEMPLLKEFCVNYLDIQNCELVVSLFINVSKMTTDSIEDPVHHYVELMKLCLSYMLRNGHVILTTKNFLDLSYEQLNVILASKYLICEEETIYRALKRWARNACRRAGLDYNNIENCRSVIGTSGTSTNEFGLLRHIRFALIDDETFSKRIHKKPNSLLPDHAADTVYKYHVLDEPTKIFIDKSRIPDVNQFDMAGFNNHINKLTNLLCPPILLNLHKVMDKTGKICVESSHDESEINSDVDSCTSVITQKLPETNFSDTRIKADLNASPEPSPEKENFVMPKIDVTDVDKTPVRNNPANPDLETPSLLRKVTVSKRILKSAKNNGSVPPVKDDIDRIPIQCTPHLNPGVTPKSTPKTTVSKRKVSGIAVKSSGSPSKKGRSSHIRNLAKYDTGNTFINDMINDHCDTPVSKTLMTNRDTAVTTFSDVIRECYGQQNLRKIILTDIKLDSKQKKTSIVPFVSLPNLELFRLGLNVPAENLKIHKGLISFLKTIKIEDFIFFFNYNKDTPGSKRFHNLWDTTEVTISFCGVTTLSLSSHSLTLNYIKTDISNIVASDNLTNMTMLNLANCNVSPYFKRNDHFPINLREVRLVNVDALIGDDILRNCDSLESYNAWPEIVGRRPISLDDISSNKLRSMSLFSHMIKVKIYGTVGMQSFPNVERLCICDCSWDPMLIANLGLYFPNLRSLGVIDKFAPVSIDLLQSVINLNSLEDILICNFDFATAEKDGGNFLKTLTALKLKTSSYMRFQLRRKEGQWTGQHLSKDDLKNYIFESFGFLNFYDYDAWLKHFWLRFDSY